jgi:allantoate deiminase
MTEMGSTTQTEIRARAAHAIAECRLLAAMSEEAGRTTRRFLTPPVADVHHHLRDRMIVLGMEVWTDAAGNLRGLWKPVEGDAGAETEAGRLVLGSHIDTVPDAGAFDGVLGVVLALEWVRLAQQMSFTRPIEVIAFSEEEGVRFGVPFIGSHAVAGSFDETLLALEDADGIRMEEAIRSFGLDPEKIGEAVLDGEALGFVEIHIEQGPVLEAEGLALAVVEGIAGQSRLVFRFVGQANHAGTTPMHLRRDALAGAAEWMMELERAAREADGLVATVGRISVEPNAGNVIPGVAEVSLDVRHVNDETRKVWVRRSVESAEAIALQRGLEVTVAEKMSEGSVPMDAELSSRLLGALEDAGYPAKKMPSGAGHDAMIMAQRVPTAMLFLRSPGGISHHPAEAVLEEDVEAAIRVGEFFLRRLA